MMRVDGADDNNVGGTATPVGTVTCRPGHKHDWTGARVGTDVQWWQCTRCAVLATTAELDVLEGTSDYLCTGCGLSCDRAAHGTVLSAAGKCVDCFDDPGWAAEVTL